MSAGAAVAADAGMDLLNWITDINLFYEQLNEQQNAAREGAGWRLDAMRRRGINPIFAAGGSGGGAALPSGGQKPHGKSNIAAGLAAIQNARANTVSSAAQMKNALNQGKGIDADVKLKTRKVDTEYALMNKYIDEAQRALQETKTSSALESKLKADEMIAKETAKAYKYNNERMRKQADLYRGRAGNTLIWLDKISELFGLRSNLRIPTGGK